MHDTASFQAPSIFVLSKHDRRRGAADVKEASSCLGFGDQGLGGRVYGLEVWSLGVLGFRVWSLEV